MANSARGGFVAIALAVACTKTSPVVVEAGPPVAPNARWEKSDLVVEGHPEWKLHLDYGAAGAMLAPRGWPGGTKLGFGASTVAADAPPAQPLPIFTHLGSVVVWRQDVEAGAFFPPDVDVPPGAALAITLPSGAVIQTMLPGGKAPPALIELAMAHAAKEGLVFDGEPATPAGPHSTYFLDPARSDDVIGPAKTLADVDWIASVTSAVEAGGGTTCTFAGGKKYPLEKETQTITITTRRTKEKIDEKVFAPATGCPMVAFDERAISSPPRDVVFAWIRDVAKAR